MRDIWGGSLYSENISTKANYEPLLEQNNARYRYNKRNDKKGWAARNTAAPLPANAIGGISWESNTALELSNVVYPDGTKKSESNAQQEVNQGLKERGIRNKVAYLNALARGGDKDALDQAEQLSRENFAQEHQANLLQSQINEIQALQMGSKQIKVSSEGHAKKAESERQAIIDELQKLRAQGLVRGAPAAGGGVPGPAPPGIMGKIGSGIADAARAGLMADIPVGKIASGVASGVSRVVSDALKFGELRGSQLPEEEMKAERKQLLSPTAGTGILPPKLEGVKKAEEEKKEEVQTFEDILKPTFLDEYYSAAAQEKKNEWKRQIIADYDVWRKSHKPTPAQKAELRTYVATMYAIDTGIPKDDALRAVSNISPKTVQFTSIYNYINNVLTSG